MIRKDTRVPRNYGALAGIVLLIFAARLYFIDQYGGPVPYWDDWRIPQQILLPWLRGTLNWDSMFIAHTDTEHRIFLVRLIALATFLFNNDQWDVMVGMVVNALLLSLSVMWVLLAAYRRIPFWAALFVLLLWLTPNALRDTLLWFFGLSWYCMIFFSIVSLCILSEALSARWWVAVTCAFLSIFSIASPAALGTIFLCEGRNLLLRPNKLRSAAGLLIVVALIGAFFMLERTTRAGDVMHDIQNRFSAAFVLASERHFIEGLAWPLHTMWAPFVIYAPFIVCAVLSVSRSVTLQRDAKTGCLLVVWVLCHVAVLSVSRDAIAGRYLEVEPFGVMGNFLILTSMARHASRRSRRYISLAIAVIWAGFIATSTSTLWYAPPNDWRQFQENATLAMRSYLSGNKGALADNAPFVPFPPHVGNETRAAIDMLQPYTPFSYHFYLQIPYRDIDADVIANLVSSHRIGALSLVTWALLKASLVLGGIGALVLLTGMRRAPAPKAVTKT